MVKSLNDNIFENHFILVEILKGSSIYAENKRYICTKSPALNEGTLSYYFAFVGV